MYIDPLNAHKGFDAKGHLMIVEMQTAGWLYESHLWIAQLDGSVKCEWCGIQRIDNFAPARKEEDRKFPLCMSNPIVQDLVKGGSNAINQST